MGDLDSDSPDVNVGGLVDVSDRAARLLGIVYGSQGQQVLQRAVSFDLLVQLRNAGVEINAATEDTLVKIIPVAKARVFNTALPAAEASLLGADISATNSPTYFRVYAAFSVSGILRVARTVGGVTVVENLYASNPLTANSGYMFTIPVRSGDTVNFRYSVTAGTTLTFDVNEISGAE